MVSRSVIKCARREEPSMYEQEGRRWEREKIAEFMTDSTGTKIYAKEVTRLKRYSKTNRTVYMADLGTTIIRCEAYDDGSIIVKVCK